MYTPHLPREYTLDVFAAAAPAHKNVHARFPGLWRVSFKSWLPHTHCQIARLRSKYSIGTVVVGTHHTTPRWHRQNRAPNGKIHKFAPDIAVELENFGPTGSMAVRIWEYGFGVIILPLFWGRVLGV